MCGIAGIWNLDGRPVDRPQLEGMTRALAHRGPDGEGFYFDKTGCLGLGHRRLAILDLTDCGKQPMPYADGRYWITFNGEIYNFIELRAELEALGHRFVSQTDTEIILAAYAQWGADCQLRFHGMWAFAIWDEQDRKLFFSRDRFGIKPLHYYHHDRRFAFASEMKAFLTLDWFDRTCDSQMVAIALTHPVAVEGTERCLLQNLRRLLGGHCLTVSADGTVKVRRWWKTLEHLEEVPQRYDEQVERFRELFFDSCRVRMRSDVPLATSLSGGLDSSSVLCAIRLIRHQTPGGERLAADWQRAFVASYPGTSQDETRHAREALTHAGARPVFCEVSPQLIVDYMETILFQFEEISDVHIGPWLVYRAQRKDGVVVSLDGHGGDELLGGYHYYVRHAIRDAMFPVPRARRLKDLKAIFHSLYGAGKSPYMPTYRAAIRELARRGVGRLYRFVVRKPRQRLMEGMATRWLREPPAPEPFPVLEQDGPQLRKRDRLFNALYRDFHCTELPTNLRNYDRLSMAHGIEVREPFLDWRLVCFVFSLPAASIIGGGFTKRILRDAMRGVLPESIRTRTTKVGFANPADAWFAGPKRQFILDVLGSQTFRECPIWKGPLVRRDVEAAYEQGDYPLILLAWRFAQAARLMQAFRDKTAVLVR